MKANQAEFRAILREPRTWRTTMKKLALVVIATASILSTSAAYAGFYDAWGNYYCTWGWYYGYYFCG